MAEFNPIALRFPAVSSVPETLNGTRPIVIFSDQGNIGAGLKDLLPAGFRPELHAGDGPPGVGAGRPQDVSLQRGLPLPHAIDAVYLVIDRSGSMNSPVDRPGSESKNAHVNEIVSQLSADYFPPDCPIRLFQFDDKSDGGVTVEHAALPSKLGENQHGNGTNFSAVLRDVERELSLAHDSNRPRRTLLLFVTDGQENFQSRVETMLLAERLQSLNVGTYVIGVGVGYDQQHIFDLTGRLGYAGWAHTPTGGQGNVFSLAIPGFIRDMRSSEHYLGVEGEGSIAAFYSLTPNIRPVLKQQMHLGYLQEGIGICFEREEDLALTLRAGRHAAESDPYRQPIEILDIDQAQAHFERIEPAGIALRSTLVFLAQQCRDPLLLARLAEEFPELGEDIAKITEMMGHSAGDNNDIRGSMSSMGHSISEWTHSRVNPWSAVPKHGPDSPPKARGGARRDDTMTGEQTIMNSGPTRDAAPPRSLRTEERHLHSGGLAGLDCGVSREIPPARQFDPRAYDRAVPYARARLEVVGNSLNAAIPFDHVDLSSLTRIGQEIIIGRDIDVNLRIDNPAVSRKHCSIGRVASGFVIKDLGSKNKTMVNGVEISQAELKNGDVIGISNIRLQFCS